MSRLRRLLDHPQEVNFWLFLATFALAIGVIYWIVSLEAAGTVLLIGFALATGAIGIRLAIDPRSRAARRRAPIRREREERDAVVETGASPDERLDPGGRGAASEGSGGIDRPFLDESGRLPTETLAPFATGLGVAIASTGLIFGPAPVLVGLLPFLWGAWSWLSGAGAELAATEADSAAEATAARVADGIEAQRAAIVVEEDGRPVEATAAGVADRIEAHRAAIVAEEDGRPVEATPGRTATTPERRG